MLQQDDRESHDVARAHARACCEVDRKVDHFERERDRGGEVDVDVDVDLLEGKTSRDGFTKWSTFSGALEAIPS